MYSFIAIEDEEKIVYQWNVPWERNSEVENILRYNKLAQG